MISMAGHSPFELSLTERYLDATLGTEKALESLSSCAAWVTHL